MRTPSTRPRRSSAPAVADKSIAALSTARRFAVISDIHGNLGALQRVLSALDRRKLEVVVCLGDVSGYGPQTRECIAALKERDIPCLRGNHDAYVGSSSPIPWEVSPAAAAGIEADRSTLNVGERRFLARLPWILRTEGFAFVHASFPNPRDWWYVVSDRDAEQHLRAQPAPVSFFGHTHVQGGWQLGPDGLQAVNPSKPVRLMAGVKYAFNPGSVGQPRDDDPRSAFLVYDRERQQVEFHRVAYDVNRAVQLFAATGRTRMGLRLLRGQ